MAQRAISTARATKDVPRELIPDSRGTHNNNVQGPRAEKQPEKGPSSVLGLSGQLQRGREGTGTWWWFLEDVWNYSPAQFTLQLAVASDSEDGVAGEGLFKVAETKGLVDDNNLASGCRGPKGSSTPS